MAAAPTPGVLTLDTDTKTLEVRADGIYETSNQNESKSDVASPVLTLTSPKGAGEEEPASSVVSSVTEPQASEHASPSQALPSDDGNALAPPAQDEEPTLQTEEALSPSTSTSSAQPQVDTAQARSRDSSLRALDAAAECTNASEPQTEDPRNSESKLHDGVVSEDTLSEVQVYLVHKVRQASERVHVRSYELTSPSPVT